MIGFYNYTVILTYMGVASAVLGLVFALRGDATSAVICLMASGLCDMFDGPVARRRKRTEQEKRFGIQIDSLADVICFGVLPAAIGYTVGLHAGWQLFVLVLFVLAALSRLAYFNVTEEDRQEETDEKRKAYEGLPVTTVALLIPAIYGFHDLLGARFPLVYAASLICFAAAFLVRVKVPKLGPLGMLCLIALGIGELIWVLI
jgi:CDP-diacylglycerol--serine O-phosphatidyltransferase